ncbi:group III truncated hemoglobin [Sphingomonas koreensis]|uniref:group III truncated hemoglobin n=1 Tax=Sphingomonas koreensis TaxID=93064 RepID=UPI000F7EFBAF|nr:group III truncated hemoglobin [Sphingomonas koreensis]RSZ08331.1 group III truncated hemoglobin [Sphingomonas koreensis]
MASERRGIDEDSIRALVGQFYARVRADPELGPVFNDAVHNWPGHLDLPTDFWSSVMLATGRYKGRPVPAHHTHAARITPGLFDRWLALWDETSDALMTPAAATALQDKARRIAESLQLALFFRLPERGTAA